MSTNLLEFVEEVIKKTDESRVVNIGFNKAFNMVG